MTNEKKRKSGKDELILEKLISGMTLEEKIGQVFQVGFTGTEVTPEIAAMIKHYHPGGIIYFRRNIGSPRQLSRLSNELQKLSTEGQRGGLPLIISTDQEGGMSHQLIGGTHFPGSMALGATGNVALTGKTGQAIARELKAVGINMDLAPVLDVNNNPENPIVGVRSFGEDPLLVSKMGRAFIEGMQAEGVIACAKHFPGHGDTTIDSHLDLPVIRREREHLEKIELYPFRQAIRAGIDSIMTAHIYFPAIEPEENIPVTLSYRVLTDLLRNELGYQGVIMTDCMEMKAIDHTFGTARGAVMAIEAGADIVLVTHTPAKQKAAIEAVIEAVKEGRISEERIDQSLRRILRLKQKRIGLSSPPVSDYRKIEKKIDEEIAEQISREGVTLVKDENHLLPVDRAKHQKILVMDFFQKRISPVEDDVKNDHSLADFLKEEGLEVARYAFPEGDSTIPPVEGFDLVIACTFDAVHDPGQIKILKKIRALNIPFVVLAICNPYDLQAFPEAPAFLTTYDYSPFSLKVAAEIISGRHRAQGVLPITLKI